MKVDPSIETPLFVQIAESIEDDVFTGVYGEGEVAALFGINPHTVLKGMNLLVDEGIIHKRRGMGMYVSDGALGAIRAKRQAAFAERYVDALVAEARKLGMTKEQVLALVEKGLGHE